MKSIAILALAFAAVSVHAGTATFVREQAAASAKSKSCVYEYHGSEIAVTIPAGTSCPASVQVWDLSRAVSPMSERGSGTVCRA